MNAALIILAASCALLQPQPPAPAPKPAPTAKPAPAAQPAPAPAAKSDGPYQVLRTLDIGGDGGWDIVTIDSGDGKLYVPRATHVMIISLETGKVIGDIPGTDGVHGVAIGEGKGFTSNGKSNDVTVFQAGTGKVLQTVKAGENPDEILYDMKSRRVLCFNGKSKDVTVISAESLSVLGTVALGGKPEFAACDGDGNVFVNLEDTSEIVKLDAAAMKVETRWPLAPAKEPTGLAIDTMHHRLFASCGNEMMAIVDTTSGKVVATPKIGKRPDGAEYSRGARRAFSSNGEGTLTVIAPTNTPAGIGGMEYEVIQTLQTARGARTMVLDNRTEFLYLPAADYEEAKPGERAKMKPGSFKILVVGEKK